MGHCGAALSFAQNRIPQCDPGGPDNMTSNAAPDKITLKYY